MGVLHSLFSALEDDKKVENLWCPKLASNLIHASVTITKPAGMKMWNPGEGE